MFERNDIERYLTIDKCLRNKTRKWTLDDLIAACTKNLEKESISEARPGRRTIQLDIQMMRDPEKGYGAPIVVVDRKYYKYSDPDFTITAIPFSEKDLAKLTSIHETLVHFQSNIHMKPLDGLILKLQDIIDSQKLHQKEVVEPDELDMKGMEYLPMLYKTIREKKAINIWYQSFKAKRPGKIVFSPFYLKEYRNRWFVIGFKHEANSLLNLALDRIKDIEVNSETSFYPEENLIPGNLYKNVIGVTISDRQPLNIQLSVDMEMAPYLLTKPLHPSQQLIKETEQGIEIGIKVIPNPELEREILSYGEHMNVLLPESFRNKIMDRIKKMAEG